MEKYTVLLVDDEEEVSQIIRKKINWEELGFSVIGYADNGIKALEMVEELQPNIVMTDIKMPYMDGMELANRIKTDYPATKILIFTGFDEFEYAKEAVHLEVEEYILKPASRMELTRVFTRLKEKLDQEIHERKNVEILQKYYLDSLPLLQANFYTTLVEGKIREEEIPKFLSDYQISFSGPFFLLRGHPYLFQSGAGRCEPTAAGNVCTKAGGRASGKTVEGQMLFLSGQYGAHRTVKRRTGGF